ncbi:MAG: hypothetical protein WC813_02470 [Patescibacteria group bacterium]|jgi:hypothetical protein
MEKSARNIITFRGEFPDSLLVPAKMIADALAPYDALTDAFEQPGDTIALFELLDLEGCFTEELIRHIPAGASLLNEYSVSQIKVCRSLREHRRYLQRLNNSLKRIMRELKANGFPITCILLNEMIATMDHQDLGTQIQSMGLMATKTARHESSVAYKIPPGDVIRSNRDFAWYEIAEAASRTPQNKFKTIIGMKTVRDMMKTVDLLFLKRKAVSMKYRFAVGLNVPHLTFCFMASNHLLSVCKLAAIDIKTKTIVADAEVARDNGEITFAGCNFLSVATAFQVFNAKRGYMFLRDIVSANLYALLTEGQIQEREYITETETGPNVPADVPIAVTGVLENAQQAEQTVGTSTADVTERLSEETPPEVCVPSPTVVGKGRFGYRNILATLFRFGVTIEKGGRHVKLRFGDKTTPFLNRHQKEDPVHNRLNLFRALEALGIPKDQFVSSL